MSRPMVSPNCPFTARASADSLEVSTPLLLRSSSYHPTSCSRARGSGRRWGAGVGRGQGKEAQRQAQVGGRLAGSCCRGGLAGAG